MSLQVIRSLLHSKLIVLAKYLTPHHPKGRASSDGITNSYYENTFFIKL